MSEPFDAADVWDDQVDEIIEEIWTIRRKMWEQFDNDPHRMAAYMRERHAERVSQGHPEINSSSPEEDARVIAACQALLRELEAQEQSAEAHAHQ